MNQDKIAVLLGASVAAKPTLQQLHDYLAGLTFTEISALMVRSGLDIELLGVGSNWTLNTKNKHGVSTKHMGASPSEVLARLIYETGTVNISMVR